MAQFLKLPSGYFANLDNVTQIVNRPFGSSHSRVAHIYYSSDPNHKVYVENDDYDYLMEWLEKNHVNYGQLNTGN